MPQEYSPYLQAADRPTKTAKVERMEKRILLYRVGSEMFSHEDSRRDDEIENGTDGILGDLWGLYRFGCCATSPVQHLGVKTEIPLVSTGTSTRALLVNSLSQSYTPFL